MAVDAQFFFASRGDLMCGRKMYFLKIIQCFKQHLRNAAWSDMDHGVLYTTCSDKEVACWSAFLIGICCHSTYSGHVALCKDAHGGHSNMSSLSLGMAQILLKVAELGAFQQLYFHPLRDL